MTKSNGVCISKQTYCFLRTGIAFEQSKCLPTPENVPFRLTRDMVAAFGVSGVDGIFRKACEDTMEVLRLNKTIIVTILEVLLHDPLYAWALSAKTAYSRQDIERADDDGDLYTKLCLILFLY